MTGWGSLVSCGDGLGAGEVSDKVLVDLAGDEAFEAADDFAFGEPFDGPPRDVVAGGLVVGHAHQSDTP